MKKILAIILCLPLFAFCSKEKKDLRYDLEVGQTYPFIMTLDMSTQQSMGAMPMSMKVETIIDMDYYVRSFENGNYRMEGNINSVKMNMDTPMGRMVIDTDGEDSEDVYINAMQAMFKGMRTVPLTMVFTEKGKVTDIEGAEEWISAIFESLPEEFGEDKEILMAEFSANFSADTFAKNFDAANAFFPEKPVAPGDKWTNKTEQDFGKPVEIEAKYRYAGEKDGYDEIMGESEFTVPGEDMLAGSEFAGKTTSEIKLDPQTGWIIEGVVKSEIDVVAHGEMANAPMKINNVMKISGKR